MAGLHSEWDRTHGLLWFLSTRNFFDETDSRQARAALAGVHQMLSDNLKDARKFRTPALTNVPAGSSLYELIVDRGDTHLGALDGDNISGEWIGKLMTRLDGVLGRVKRLHFKSLGSLLALQEKLAGEWAVNGRGVGGVATSMAAASPPPGVSRGVGLTAQDDFGRE